MARTILITGGNRGLGLSLVETFANAGWKVLATARTVASLPTGLENVKGYTLDLARQEDVVKLASKLVNEDKVKIDVIIHNAGFNPKDQKHREGYFESTFNIDKFSAENVNESMTINALHPMELTGRMMPVLSENAIVIAISSWFGSFETETIPGHYGYRGSKALMNMMMKGLSLEFTKAKENRVAIALNPGWMKVCSQWDDELAALLTAYFNLTIIFADRYGWIQR
mmetsp:Transcript_29637/g.69010  ORF Transcript_29637/g.69010 Transcript_29637/m.69010 type:complete len:227 (+) Transcript_29637:39-719(+)